MTTSPPTAWRRSSRCSNATCLEVADDGKDSIMIRDSKHEASPILTFNRDAWISFLNTIKNGDLDR